MAAWRATARRALSHHLPPERLLWRDAEAEAQGGLFTAEALPPQDGGHHIGVPREFLRLAGSVIWHSAPERFDLLYRALWRLDQKDGAPLSAADPLGRRLQLLAKAVGRDIHKTHAFVRFRETPRTGARRHFAAWFEPEHDTLEPAAPFFAKRFGDMDWMIVTPRLLAECREGVLAFREGRFARPDLPDDATEALWGTYFANIFNPARVKLTAMRSEMPKKYWKNLPETQLIPAMLKDAEARVERMHAAATTSPSPAAQKISTRYRDRVAAEIAEINSLGRAQKAALGCQACGLCTKATQTIWGEGAPKARLMLVGEQPGHEEDLQGRPFIGPAGQLLRQLIAQAPIDTAQIYLTNAVKHFKFKPQGKMRLHQSPDRREILACRRWLGHELDFIAPKLTLALGASAAFALTGNDAPLGHRRGGIEIGLHDAPVLITWHPAALLRAPDPATAASLRADMLADFRAAQTYLSDT